jgi:hypothetical protein
MSVRLMSHNRGGCMLRRGKKSSEQKFANEKNLFRIPAGCPRHAGILADIRINALPEMISDEYREIW